ncbi:MAG TPA: kelch repeat-containing protein, partial [Candidatus Bathyarchaeia archaeon]|nr:kelch repeat-containing protein [Candidatus Bathyarchaeia archaeon]
MKSAAKLGSLVLLPLMMFTFAGCEKKSETTTGHKWGWISGADIVDQIGVYGTLATPAAANVPGSREDAASWRDASGRFWLFGGYGFDAAGYRDRLNDLWVYDPTSGNWAWMAGGTLIDEPAVYGTRGVVSASNIPGARNGSVAWVDAGGTVWLFGGLNAWLIVPVAAWLALYTVTIWKLVPPVRLR